MNPIDQLALLFQINYLCIQCEIEQPENCKAFIPMHRTVYEFIEDRRIANVKFLMNCKASLKMMN